MPSKAVISEDGDRRIILRYKSTRGEIRGLKIQAENETLKGKWRRIFFVYD